MFDPRVVKLAGDAFHRFEAVQEAGVELDEFGMVVPKLTESTREKIADNLMGSYRRIESVLRRGKHVLYLPGSYDLVHVGHASYILEGIESYMAHADLQRDALFVVVLADDDQLIRAIKPPYKVDRLGSPARPIENAELFEFVTDVHPRLMDLASLPVDWVGFIPGPTGAKPELKDPTFMEWLEYEASSDGEDILGDDEASHQARSAIASYQCMLNLIKSDQLVEVLKSFATAQHIPTYDPGNENWNVAAWQLMIHRYLGSNRENGPFVRVISEHDGEYKDLVERLMAASRIDTGTINDTFVLSTTQLVDTVGWEPLYESKWKAYTEG